MQSADLAAALRDPTSPKNVVLMPRDRIIVFDAESGRQQMIAPLIEEMRRQSRIDQPTEIVRIDGRIKARGDYPLEPTMRVSDLLRAGGTHDAHYGAKAELTRYRVNGDTRQTQLVEIDLAAIMRGDESADLLLQPFDFLNVKKSPSGVSRTGDFAGRGAFPGQLPDPAWDETLRSVLDRAGGLTALAFPSGSVFTRVELREREQQQIDRLAERMQVTWRSWRCRQRRPIRARPARR
jgi:protein involved in polysaccharide export with SLBB domain